LAVLLTAALQWLALVLLVLMVKSLQQQLQHLPHPNNSQIAKSLSLKPQLNLMNLWVVLE
jgi:hypothetical protein